MSAWTLQWLLIGAGAVVALAVARRRADLDRIDLALVAALPIGGGVVLAHLFERIANGPHHTWNAGRVATSVALARGFDIYPTLDEGAILDFMYGPMAAIVYLPAAIAASPSGAIQIGVAASLFFAVAPFAWYASRAFAPDERLLAAAAVVCFALLCIFDPGLDMAAWSIHADAPAIGLAGLACACLLVAGERASNRRLFVVAAIAALAVWSKQIAAPIVLALPTWVWLCNGRREALRCTAWLGGVGAAISLGFVLYFGFEDLFLNMFRIPSSHPWKPAASKLAALLESFARLAWTARFPLALIVGVAALTRPRADSLRGWLRAQPWLGFVWTGLWMAPTAAMGQAKVGGSLSSFAMTTWFLAAAAIAGTAKLAATESPATVSAATKSPRIALAARLVLLGIVAFAAAVELGSPDRRRAPDAALFELRNLDDNPQEQAVAFARAHPGEVLVLANPLIGLYSDGALYHSLKGYLDRMASGLEPPGPELLRAHNPPRLRYIAQRKTSKPTLFRRPEFFYPAFDQRVRPERMDHHTVWTAPAATGTPRPPSTR